MKIYAIIPARGGSKSVPRKNIKPLGGFPLLAYSIAAAKLSKKIDRIIVSTDNTGIAAVGRKYGAEVPFLRPAEFASDSSTDYDVLGHVLGWLEKNEKKVPDLFVYLRPTTPLRDPALIDKAIEYLNKKLQATSLRSGHELAEPPQKMFQINKEGFFEGFFPNDPSPDYYDLPRQNFPQAYHPNGYIDIVRVEILKKSGTTYGKKILSFVVPVSTEIDRPEDFKYLEYQFYKKPGRVFNYLNKKFR